MASVYDEINKIKREGSDYDSSLTNSSNSNASKETINAIFPALTQGQKNINNFQTPFIGDKVDPDFGNSKYDKNVNWEELVYSDRTLEDIRAERQPWYSQLANNLVNTGVIATTTFADSFAGTAAGIVNMAFSPYDSNSELSNVEQGVNKFVNNPVSLWLNSINKWVKTTNPTYHSDQYSLNQANGEWWKNFGTSTFWGENIIENAGFTLGMVASGKASGNILNKISNIAENSNIIKKGINTAIQEGKLTGDADKIFEQILSGKRSLETIGLDKQLSNAVKSINQASSINRNVATALAVTGEARQEGINASQEYEQKQFMNLNSLEGQQELLRKTILDLASQDNTEYLFKSNPLEGDPLQSINPEYLDVITEAFNNNKAKAEQAIKDGSARVAGMDFALNFPVLYGSSLWQFGKTFTRGYDTQKGFFNNIKGALRDPINNTTLEGSKKIVKEGSEYVFKNSLKDKITTGLKIASNPLVEGNEEMLQSVAKEASFKYVGAKMNSFLGYKLDPEAEQNKIGVLNSIWNGIIDTYSNLDNYQEGFAGVLMGGAGVLNFSFSKNANGKRPIIEGGVWQDIRDAKQENQELQEATIALNKRVSDPNFLNYYQGIIRHDAFESNKENALNNDDKFSFLNNDHAQLISDIIMFDKAGKIQDLYDNIDSNIEKFSTEDKTKISEIADELRELAVNKDTGQDLFNNKTDEEIVKESLKFNQDLKDNVDSYRKTVNNLKSIIGSSFQEEDSFNEMVYLFSHIDNLEKRYKDLHNSLTKKIEDLNIPEINTKLFPINLDNSEKNLTLAEIINQATPSELNEFLLGKSVEDLKDFDYMNLVMSSNKAVLNNLSSVINTINSISNNTNKRGDTTNQQKIAIGKQKEIAKSLYDTLSKTKERESIMRDIIDLLKIEDSRYKLTNTYNRYVGQPYLLKEHLETEKEIASQEQENIINGSIIDELKQAPSIRDVRQLVGREINEKNNTLINNIIDEMSLSDNKNYSPLVSEYKKVENLGKQIINDPIYKSLSEDITNGIDQLYDVVKNRSNTYEEVTNPIITQDDLSELGNRNSLYTQQERDNIKNNLLKILSNINNKDQKYNSLSKPFKANIEENAKNEKSIENNSFDKPIGNISQKELTNINTKDIKVKLDDKNKIVASTDKVWNNGTFEIDIDAYNNLGVIKDQTNPIYKPAVDYLKQNGAFNYINSSKLKRGDKIYFYASEEYWKNLIDNGVSESWVNTNKPLLLVTNTEEGSIINNNKKYQVVGTFNSKLNKYLHTKVLENKSKGIDENISTTVVNVTPGRLEFNQEKLLSSLEGKTPWGEDSEILFGIADETGQLTTNLSSVDYGIFNITSNTNYSNSGRLYLLTKSASSGNYIPSAVRVKTLNEVDYSKDIPLFNELRNSVSKITKASLLTNEDKVADAVHDLRNILYVGSKAGIKIDFKKDSQYNRTDYNLVIDKDTGEREVVNIGYSETQEVNLEGKIDYQDINNFNKEEDITNNILNALSNIKAPFQVNRNYINGKWNVRQSLDYNNVLLQADILTSNLANNYVRGAYFVINPLDTNLNEVFNTNTTVNKQNNSTSKNTVTNTYDNTPKGKPVNISGNTSETYYITDKGEVLNRKGELVEDISIINTVKINNYISTKTPEELNDIKFKGEELFPGGSFLSDRLYYLMPSSQVWDATTNTLFPKDSMYSRAINNLLEERKKESDKSTVNEDFDYISEDDVIVSKVSLFDNEETSPQPERKRKKPSKGSVSKNILDISSNSSLTKEEIQNKIDNNKDYQKDNCNGIAPI